jgi:hypothetical protein
MKTRGDRRRSIEVVRKGKKRGAEEEQRVVQQKREQQLLLYFPLQDMRGCDILEEAVHFFPLGDVGGWRGWWEREREREKCGKHR